jgi:selenide, water dikinase
MGMLPPVSHPNLLVGTSTADDAGVYRLSDSLALVNTVDVITPLVDNPYDFGRIAAANSLSDIYAMGGKPVTALNITGFSEKKVDLETVAEIIRGATDKANEAGCPIVGGHTIKDEELKIGLAVTGTIDPSKIIRNSTARVGDKLILTKPLGMGILTTALKAGKLTEAEIERITSVMVQLNRVASELMVRFGAHAATDVTGFGLLGHAHEVARGSGVELRLDATAIPYLPEAMAMTMQSGFISGGTVKNKEFLEQHVSFSPDVNKHEQMIFYDAQTSGGLLIAASEDVAEQLLAALHDEGIVEAVIIGEVTDGVAGKIIVDRQASP